MVFNSLTMLFIKKLVSYLPLLNIFLGLLGNTTCLIIFRLSKTFKKNSIMVYLSFVAVFNTISLFEWNLNHFLKPNFSIRLEDLNNLNCKLVNFIQIFSLQTSSFLLSMMTIDRYIYVCSTPGSFLKRLPFSSVKCAFNWSIIITIFFCLANIHILILNKNIEITKIPEKNESLLYGLNSNKVYCHWNSRNLIFLDKINIVFYNLIPFFLMIIFNGLLIYKVLKINKLTKKYETTKTNVKKQKRIFLILAINFVFILFTMPSSIGYGFFSNNTKNETLFHFLDFLGFFFHSNLFLICIIANGKFRNYCFKTLKFFIKK